MTEEAAPTKPGELARIEGLSDAVFAFAVTLLVVSLEVPTTFDELEHAMLGFPAFGVCFTLLMLIWYAQHSFFRRWTINDPMTIALNAALLFLVLLYVYPLKFLWTLLFDQLLGLRPEGGMATISSMSQMKALMITYALGFIAVFLVFVLLYTHVIRKRGVLGLGPLDVFDARSRRWFYSGFVGVGALSLLIMLVGGVNWSGVAGFTYGLLGPVLSYHGTWHRKARAKLAASLGGGAPA